jgi:hypothetical protein
MVIVFSWWCGEVEGLGCRVFGFFMKILNFKSLRPHSLPQGEDEEP